MIRSTALFFAILASAAAARAQFDSPVWYLQYEVSMKANHTARVTDLEGIVWTSTWVIDRTFSAGATLDMRTDGPLITTVTGSSVDPEKLQKMSQADQMKFAQEMLESMQYSANWMPGPLDISEIGEMNAHILSVSVPVHIHYDYKSSANDVPDGMGDRYDYLQTRAAEFTGGTLYAGDQYKLEINNASKKYWLVLPYGGQDFAPETKGVNWEHTNTSRRSGTAEWAQVERTSSESRADWLPGDLKFAGSTVTTGWPVIEGQFDASGKIAGEKTFNATFVESGVEVPIAVTFRYALTTNPPAKK